MSNVLSHLDDAELVLRAQEGSSSAFGEIYDRHAPGVARALASFAGPDHDLLDDLVQDVFLRVIGGLRSYTASHPFPHWLYTIALNVGRNHARRQSKVVAVNPAELENLAGGTVSSPRWSPEWSQELATAALMRLVARLPVAMREVVSLRVGSEMSFGEIAEVLGIPEGTARSRMHTALGILRDHFQISERRRSREHE